MARCECPERAVVDPMMVFMYEPEERKAMSHEPNECPGDYGLRAYVRGDNVIWLCSCCCLLGDVAYPQLEFDEEEEEDNA